MDHYLDIRLRPDPEFSAVQLMNALFGKLHRALVQLNSRDIGVSFPDVKPNRPNLGGCMRLHGTRQALQRLMAQTWFTGMQDYLEVAEIATTPPTDKYCHVRRVQTKSSPERLRRRQMRRHGLTAEQAQQRIPDSMARTLALPYLTLRSSSTGQQFRLFIDHDLRVAPSTGSFNAYGLSPLATVPWF